MDDVLRPASGRSRMGTKSDGYSEYGETSGIASGTQSPSHDERFTSPTPIRVPSALDGLIDGEAPDDSETRDQEGDTCDVMQTEEKEDDQDEGFDQGDTDSDQGQIRLLREVKFSDEVQPSGNQTDSDVSRDDSADEEEGQQRHGTPVEDLELVETLGEPFTIFAIMPSKDVITLREVLSGSTVFNVQAMIELSGGVPSECYSLVSSNTAERLPTDARLILGGNITAGATMRVVPHIAFMEAFRAIWHNDIDFLQKNGEACLMSNMDLKEAEERESNYRNRLFLCLFMTCALGLKQMSQLLIEMGADVSRRTIYGNTVLHAAARHNQLILVDLLLKNGAKPCQNVFGKTVTEVAKEAGAFSCERYLRLHKWSLTGQNYVISPRPSPNASKPTSATSQRSNQSLRFLKSQVFLPKGADNMRTDAETGQFFSKRILASSANLPNIGRRCQSAPVQRSMQKYRPSTTRGGSKYHKQCLQRNGVITVSKTNRNYLGADTVKYIDHPAIAYGSGSFENMHVVIPTAKTDTGLITMVKDANTVDEVETSAKDLEKQTDDPDRTVLAETLYRWENDQNQRQSQKKPRAKSASARLYKSHFHKYLEPQEPEYYSRVKELRERRAQTAVPLPEEQGRQMKNEAAYQGWLSWKTAKGAFSKQESEDIITLPSQKHSKEENDRAFERWLENKEDEEPQRMNCQERRQDREVVVEFGCTDPEEPITASPEDNHLSYQRWLLSQRAKGIHQYTSDDESSDELRRRTEDKRRKTILNVKAYEEWMEEKEEEEEVKRKMFTERKQVAQQANEEKKQQRAPNQVPFTKWLTMTDKKRKKDKDTQRRQNEERAEEKRLQKEEWSTGTNVKSFKQWYLLQGKPVKGSQEERATHVTAEAEKEERARLARETYDSWAIQKALQDLQLEKTKLRQEERKLERMRTRKQPKLY